MDLDSLPSTPEARAMAQKWIKEAEAQEPQEQPQPVEPQEPEPVVEDQPASQDYVEPEQPIAHAQPDPTEDLSTRNFKALRETKRKIERERDEMARRLAEYERYVQQARPEQAQQQEPEIDDLPIGADEIAEGKHLKQLNKKIKQLEDQIKNYSSRTSEITAEARLKAQYNDFDQVVSRENIELLRDMYPELAQTLHHNPDIYSKAVSTYTMIKNLGIAQQQTFDNSKAIAQKNAAKPKPLAAVAPQIGESPLHKANLFANGLTEELQQQLRKEMYAARKNH